MKKKIQYLFLNGVSATVLWRTYISFVLFYLHKIISQEQIPFDHVLGTEYCIKLIVSNNVPHGPESNDSLYSFFFKQLKI